MNSFTSDYYLQILKRKLIEDSAENSTPVEWISADRQMPPCRWDKCRNNISHVAASMVTRTGGEGWELGGKGWRRSNSLKPSNVVEAIRGHEFKIDSKSFQCIYLVGRGVSRLPFAWKITDIFPGTFVPRIIDNDARREREHCYSLRSNGTILSLEVEIFNNAMTW